MKIIEEQEINALKVILKTNKSPLKSNLLIELLKESKTKRDKFFINNVINRTELEISDDRFNYMLKEGILYLASEIDMKVLITIKGLIITIYGMTEVPKHVDDLLNDLNKEYFSKSFEDDEKAPLELREKVAIIVLLGLLSFSKNYSLKISTLRSKKETPFIDCIRKSADFLASLPGYEDEKEKAEKLFQNTSEGNVGVTFLRRLDNIQVRTESVKVSTAVYVKSGGEHYLDLLEGNSIKDKNLSYLLRRVFNKRTLTFEERKSFINLLNEIEKERIYLMGNNPDFQPTEIISDLSYKIKSYKSLTLI